MIDFFMAGNLWQPKLERAASTTLSLCIVFNVLLAVTDPETNMKDL